MILQMLSTTSSTRPKDGLLSSKKRLPQAEHFRDRVNPEVDCLAAACDSLTAGAPGALCVAAA